MIETIKRFTFDLSSLFFPEICEACDELLIPGEKIICTTCMISLPRTGFHMVADNPVARQFYGKVMIHSAAAFWHFQKRSKVQRLLHRLKYEKKPEIGYRSGELYGQYLKESELFSSVNVIIPVPLHPSKMKIRGYNQATSFAEGLSESMKIPCNTRILYKDRHTKTQTHKSRFDRYLNSGGAYMVNMPEQISDSHVLLVDDVITTGSTLEVCSHKLQEAGNVKVSLAAIAFADG